MYKAVSVIELLCGDIQSWLKEETTLVMKGEKKNNWFMGSKEKTSIVMSFSVP